MHLIDIKNRGDKSFRVAVGASGERIVVQPGETFHFEVENASTLTLNYEGDEEPAPAAEAEEQKPAAEGGEGGGEGGAE